MCRIITKITITILLVCFSKIQAQEWEVITSLPQIEFTAIKSIDGKLYAASENKLFTTTDGNTWSVENIHPITITPNCITIYNNKLYIGTTENGVYYRNTIPGSPWSHALLGLHISNFTVYEGSLYICSNGSGVWKDVNGTWNNMTSNLANYTYNVNKMFSHNGNLYAFAGNNGAFYKFDSTLTTWTQNFYYSSSTPDMVINDALNTNNTFLVANGALLLRSDNHGQTWENDDFGLVNGFKRLLYKGANSIYSLTIDFANETQFQKRNTNASSQSNWDSHNEQLPFYSYAMEEFSGKIYIASNQGVFAKADSTLGVENPDINNPKVIVFPSLSINGIFTIKSNITIEKLNVFDLNGRIVLSKTINAFEDTLNIQTKGMFLIQLISNGATITKKVIVQ